MLAHPHGYLAVLQPSGQPSQHPAPGCLMNISKVRLKTDTKSMLQHLRSQGAQVTCCTAKTHQLPSEMAFPGMKSTLKLSVQVSASSELSGRAVSHHLQLETPLAKSSAPTDVEKFIHFPPHVSTGSAFTTLPSDKPQITHR